MPEVYRSSKTAKKSSSTSDVSSKRLSKPKDAREYSQVMREEHETLNPFSAFMVRPTTVSLNILDEEEQILLLLRRAVITNIPWVLVALLMIIAPIFFSAFPPYMLLPSRFQLVTVLLWYLLTTAFILEQFLGWYFNVFIVTDERVIDVDFKNLVYKNISAAKIEHVEDVTAETSGAIPSFFNFGTVTLQTAGSVPEFEIRDTPWPSKVAKFLHEMMMEEEQERIEGRVR